MDLRLKWSGMGADFARSGTDLATDDGLETAVIVSLFTDRRAEADDALPGALPSGGDTDRRGWWADAYVLRQGDAPESMGSRLWLLGREKALAKVLEQAREYAEEALAWMVDDGVAAQVQAVAERQGDRLALGVTIQRPRQPPAQFRFETFWQGA